MKPSLVLFVPLLAALVACAPRAETPTTDDARAAMQARMERFQKATVKVTEVREFKLSDCNRATSKPGVVCTVQMDVSFTMDGEPLESSDRDQVRFVREDGVWKAYSLP